MEWFYDLLFKDGVAHAIAILGLTIAVGKLLGRVKIAGISFGVTWILFVGLLLSHWGLRIDSTTLKFMQEFGLILFIFSIGLQVGPGFFSSFKSGGVTLNMLASLVVLLGVGITVILYFTTGLPITTMVGILSGAVTNTPGMGAAQQAYSEMTGNSAPDIAMGYAVAYPLGVVGIILSIIAVRGIFRISLSAEREDQRNKNRDKESEAVSVSLVVKNPGVFGKDIRSVEGYVGKNFVISRVFHDDHVTMANSKTVLEEGDRLLIVASPKDIEAIKAFIGNEVPMERSEWNGDDVKLVSKKIIVTKSSLNGKTLAHLNLRASCGVTVTRVERAGLELVAHPSLSLQVGDRVLVVGTKTSVENATKLIGNSMTKLREPHLSPIFFGIFLGIVLGSIPFHFPGIPQPVKLGLAGGPLIISILIGRFGHHFKMVTYTTISANLMLREVGISLFLACVGIGAGEGFVETIANGGYVWIGYGAIITILPLLIVGFIGRVFCKINYFTLMGLMSGSMTDPPALAYSNSIAGNDLPAVSYATVYPLTMFLRVVSAQLLVLFLL